MDRLILASNLSLDNLYGRFPILASPAVNGLQLLTMVWNVLLALAPLIFYLLLKNNRRRQPAGFWKKSASVFLFIFWLLFFPNAAYIMTDARHLLDYCPAGSPYQVCPANAWMTIFFFAYSAIGWVLFYYNLKFMSGLIGKIFNKLWSNILILAVTPLAAAGVLFGLLNRLNSWDLFFNPSVLWRAIIGDFSNFYFIKNWLISTALLYLLYFAGDAIFKKIKA